MLLRKKPVFMNQDKEWWWGLEAEEDFEGEVSSLLLTIWS